MNIKGRFVVGKHPHFGTLGLKMEGREHFDPLGPMAVAHDLMEHFEDDDGTPEHELLAIGAGWYVRDHGRYLELKGFPRFNSLREHLHANLKNVRDELRLRVTGMLQPCPMRVAEMNIPSSISDMLAAAALDADADQTLLVLARDWLKWGYVRAADRYSPHTAASVCATFGNVEDLVAHYLASDERKVGDHCIVQVFQTASPQGLAAAIIG